MADPIEAFQFPVDIDRRRGAIKQENDYARYVAQLIRQVLLTSPGERAHRPDFGAGLLRMVFAPTDDATAALLQSTVFQSLNQWLGTLITVEDVTTRAVESTIEVTVTYTIKSRGTRDVLNLQVTP